MEEILVEQLTNFKAYKPSTVLEIEGIRRELRKLRLSETDQRDLEVEEQSENAEESEVTEDSLSQKETPWLLSERAVSQMLTAKNSPMEAWYLSETFRLIKGLAGN